MSLTVELGLMRQDSASGAPVICGCLRQQYLTAAGTGFRPTSLHYVFFVIRLNTSVNA